MSSKLPFVVAISAKADATARELSGPKTANLGNLRKYGLNVPMGFAVTTAAFERAIELSGAKNDLLKLEQKSKSVRGQELAKIAEAMQNVTKSVALPEALQEDIATFLSDLEANLSKRHLRLAVRSSATGEDAADKSFAGQYESYLGVCGLEDLLQAVKDCWASLFGERALEYRNKASRSFIDSPMAVCVVELIEARSAGVAFSVDAVSGKRDRIVIESTWGFGEALVQGLVTPDRYLVDKDEIRLFRQEIGEKKTISEFDENAKRVIELQMPDDMQTTNSLEEAICLDIAANVLKLEETIGEPVDVEWVVEEDAKGSNRLVFVQMRPISTLPDDPGVLQWKTDLIGLAWREESR